MYKKTTCIPGASSITKPAGAVQLTVSERTSIANENNRGGN